MAVVDLGRRGRWAFSVRSWRPPEVSLEELIESASGADPGAVRDRGVGEGGCLKEVYCRMNLAADDPAGGGAARESLEVSVEVSPAQSECCGEFFHRRRVLPGEARPEVGFCRGQEVIRGGSLLRYVFLTRVPGPVAHRRVPFRQGSTDRTAFRYPGPLVSSRCRNTASLSK